MERYCKNCDKNYSFKIISVTDLDHLTCPVCGEKIPKDARAVYREVEEGTRKTEESIGNIFYFILKFSYIFYLLFGVAGTILCLLHLDKAAMVLALISGLIFLGSAFSERKKLLIRVLVVGLFGYLGYRFSSGINGICLGFFIMLILRHIGKDILWKLMWKFICFARKC